MSAFTGTSIAIAGLALLWVAIAAAVAIMAARRFRLAETVLGVARTSAALLEAAPARPLLVRPDSRIEVDPQLLRDLGLTGTRARFDALAAKDGGIDPDDLKALGADIEAARASAQRFARTVRTHGSARVFEVRGGPAPAPEPPGTLLLWFYDTSTGEEDRARLALKLHQTESALDSLTHLIEAAPFPMWYRGPDLKLGLVNTAFVDAVEGRDAADVISRGLE